MQAGQKLGSLYSRLHPPLSKASLAGEPMSAEFCSVSSEGDSWQLQACTTETALPKLATSSGVGSLAPL